MSVVIETTLGDITVDLFIKQRPRACQNFLKLCKMKYYNFNLFHTVSRRFIAQTGDPTGSRNGGESIFGVLEGPHKRFFAAETNPRIKHTVKGLISFVGNEENMIGSQFFFTLGDDLTYLDGKHCVFGEVAEGMDVLELIDEAICDSDDRPYQDIRITHTVILDDPLPDLEKMVIPSRSPSPSAERLQGGRIAPDEEIDAIAGKTAEEINEMIAEREAKARATILEMVGDLPDADMAPPENILFVCKLNPVTTDDDLEIIFSRFGKIRSCEVIRDHKTGDSLQYAFIEFAEKKSCEDAYFKMDNVLIDDRRIHVDFSQSVSKVKWMGKGRGVKHFSEKDSNKDIEDFKGNGHAKSQKYSSHRLRNYPTSRYDNKRHQRRSRTPSREYRAQKHNDKKRSPTFKKSRDRSRSRSTPPPRNKRVERESRSPSHKYKKSSYNRERSESRSRRSKSPTLKKNRSRKGRSRSTESRSLSPTNKKNNSTKKQSSSPEYKKSSKNREMSESRSRRSKSPTLKKRRSRKARSTSTESSSSSPINKRRKTKQRHSPSPEYKKSKTKSESKRRKSKSPTLRKNRSRSRTSGSISPDPLTKKKVIKENKSDSRKSRSGSTKHKGNASSSREGSSLTPKNKGRSSSSDSSERCYSPDNKKPKNRRNRSLSPRDEKLYRKGDHSKKRYSKR